MEELNITIDCLKQDKQRLGVKIVSFSSYGKSPSDDDYLEMLLLLENWKQIKGEINCLEQVVSAIISNQKSNK